MADDDKTKELETKELDSLRAKLKEVEDANKALSEEIKGKRIAAQRAQEERDKLKTDYDTLSKETVGMLNDFRERPEYYAQTFAQAAQTLGRKVAIQAGADDDAETVDPKIRKLEQTVQAMAAQLEKSNKALQAMFQEQQKSVKTLEEEKKQRVGERFNRTFNEKFKDVKWKNDAQKSRASQLFHAELLEEKDGESQSEDGARDAVMDVMSLVVEKPESAAEQVARLNTPEGFLVGEVGAGGEPAPEPKVEELGRDEFIAQISKRNVALMNMADQAEQGMESSAAVS